ncbi:85/88 kDa calcium-independent phospholipase A2 isoform X1 [Folsomia candida]|uniref:85/88 kDa calcium-independent phospholipase A2 isoform X1 n=1 Tax=Folsomia candida TaxID=158441 RepID=UPI001604C248|nr:85/88 kDa calcium-independent phospholipase A2 isoform X1 [Folsomia candida]
MANIQGFGEIIGNLSRSVINTAFNAAANSASRAMDGFTVQEITGAGNIDDVTHYPVLNRTMPLLLYGPVPPGRFLGTRPAYHVILHATNSSRMFSMLRSDNRKEAEDTFVLYKESFPLLVECDPMICDTNKLDAMARKLRENPGWTAPHLASSSGLLNCLKHEKMKVKLNEQEGTMLRTPLQIAIDQGNIGVISTLLELGVDVTIADIKGNSVFHVAATKSLPAFQLLLDKLPIRHHELLNHINAEGFTPLHSACKNNNAEIVKTLLAAGANSNVSSQLQGFPIHVAVKAQSVLCLQELVAHNPSQLQMKDLQEGGSPLHWAAGPETLIPLLDLGCDPNTTDANGLTPLHNAVRRGCLKSTIYLLCHGAFPDMKGGEDDDTPLHVASRLCSKTLMQALIVFGCDVNLLNKRGDNSRHLVCTSQRSDKDQVLYILSAIGAMRCSPSKASSCVDGCKFSGSFEGSQPPNFPTHGAVNLMHEALSALGNIQAGGSGHHNNNNKTDSAATSSFADSLDPINLGGRLLCLDGGGIRGMVLTQMLAVIQKELDLPVIEMFDWIAGTSTGGILALALSVGKTPLETQCIYMRLKDKVFVGERPYSATVMEEFLKQEFGCETTMGSIHRPKVMIMTALVDRRPVDLHIFRNYISPSVLMGETEVCEVDHSSQCVWEAAKVTGAAPSYFRLDNDKFIDGGLISNNPTLDAMTEMQRFKTAMKKLGYFRNGEKFPTTVVSLGTGIPPKTSSTASAIDITWPSGIFDTITKVPRLASLVNLLIDQATQSEGQVVERARAWCSSIDVPFFRFSPQMTVDVGLDEKNDVTLINLLWETRCFMMSNKDTILKMKHILVQQQQSRVPTR